MALAAVLLTGCGAGPDFGGTSRNSAFDSGLGGSYGGYGGSYGSSGYGGGARQNPNSAPVRGTYPKVEASFELSDVKGNPFDYTENDVMVTITKPDRQTLRIPAFFDGGKTWRVRYTPDESGHYAITRVTLNSREEQPDKFEKREFDVTGSVQPGFIRRDPRDKTRFAFDNGGSYYPIGHDVAWGSGKPGDIAGMFEKMGKAGENWSRVWMDHWDGKNLDWVTGKKLALGTLDLDAIKRWDEIVDAAEKNGIHFQMTLQHHGQYTTRVNPNWDENPWNKKNGGFLSTPDEFFSNSQAVALTKAKYRYILARWGYSTAIMAWELFNEVEWTDAVAHKHQDEVAAWHNGMVEFLRQQDPYKHLITSSSGLDKQMLGDRLDYWQPHAYPPDAIAAVTGLDARKLDRPVFFGEIGPGEGLEKDDGTFLRRALWGSLMSETGGAAQYWSWDVVDSKNLYGLFTPAVDFVKQSGLLSKRGLLPIAAGTQTAESGPLTFGPGGGWSATKQTEFTVLPSGAVDGIGMMPAYLQGSAHREMFGSATFKVTYPQAGTFSLTVGIAAKAGAHVVISVDGQKTVEKDFPAAEKDTAVNATLEAKVPAGAHTILVENTGADWVTLKRFALTPYAPALAALGKGGKDYAALWVYARGETPSSGISGKLTIPGLQAGAYKATWWDTAAGKPLNEESVTVASGSPLALTTPAITRDAALYIMKTAEKTAVKPAVKKAKGKG
jgi:hypothetical protein